MADALNFEFTSCKYGSCKMFTFYIYMKQNKKHKQTLKSAQYRLEIIFKHTLLRVIKKIASELNQCFTWEHVYNSE